MEKIPTIFERDDRGGVYPDPVVAHQHLEAGYATEKVDGMNVRITVRNSQIVRLEARKNPTKVQKAQGIVDPWYRDGDPYDTADQYIYDAARTFQERLDNPKERFLDYLYDGEFSAEAVGPKIQGNPLDLEEHDLIVFSELHHRNHLVLDKVPVYFDEIREYLENARSTINPDVRPEGIVWWGSNGPIGKIKYKDFK